MNIVIVLDSFTGHLFHDIELYIVAFEKMKNLNYECDNMYFLKPDEKYNENKLYTNWNNLLRKKLFNKDNFHVINNLESIQNPLIIDRKKINHKNINKTFVESIYNFPIEAWSKCFSNDYIIGKKIKILYVIRCASRSLDSESHNNLCSIITKYDKSATICDMGTLCCESQINTFRNHNVVIGVHGNNLSGVMWMNPESFVFEILPTKFKNYVYDYHCMSLCMKHNYTQIDCDCPIDKLNSTYTLNKNNLQYIECNLKLLSNILS
jgi:hypothetical protein